MISLCPKNVHGFTKVTRLSATADDGSVDDDDGGGDVGDGGGDCLQNFHFDEPD